MLIKFRITLFSDGVFRRHHSSGRCAPRGVLGTLENQTKKDYTSNKNQKQNQDRLELSSQAPTTHVVEVI